jgi:hypothetical protein
VQNNWVDFFLSAERLGVVGEKFFFNLVNQKKKIGSGEQVWS